MNKYIKEALKYKRAIFIEDSKLCAVDVDMYVIGIQEIKQNYRFAKFFQETNQLIMYFKHDIREINELYWIVDI